AALALADDHRRRGPAHLHRHQRGAGRLQSADDRHGVLVHPAGVAEMAARQDRAVRRTEEARRGPATAGGARERQCVTAILEGRSRSDTGTRFLPPSPPAWEERGWG